MKWLSGSVSKVHGDVADVTYGVCKRDYHPGGTGHFEGGGVWHDGSCIWLMEKKKERGGRDVKVL